MTFHKRLTAPAASIGFVLALTLLAAAPVTAQTTDDILWGPSPNPTDPADYNVGANWPEFGTLPQASQFNENAIINNGGTAFLEAAALVNPGGVTLGGNDAMGGTLEIRDGGSLTVEDNGVTRGDVLLSSNGGVLVVDRGGSLTSDRIAVFAGTSSATFGGGAGTGSTTVNTGAVFTGSDFRIIGPNVTFNMNQLQLGGQSNLIAEITGPTHSVLNVSGFAQLNGEITLDFNGHTPAAGDAWTIIDAVAMAAQVNTISSETALSPGFTYAAQQVAGGNGTQLNVSVEEVLTLKINRASGQTSIVNESGMPVGASGYSITSPGGSLSTNWTSLADGNVATFEEASSTANNLAELDPNGTTSFDATGRSLGMAYSEILPAFGTAPADDITFTFQRDDGREIEGLVEIEGDSVSNTLKLTIDPATGNARVTNDSLTDIELDVYTISSASDSLLTSWNSLQDQGTGDWQEANPSTGRLSELEPTGELAFSGGSSFDLDGLWNTITGVQDVDDFIFTFRDPTLGTFTGVVEFAAISDGLAGDYNDDGVVNAVDYAIWREALGTATVLPNDPTPGVNNTDDYNVWKGNFGATSSPGAGAVATPEPAAWGVALLAIVILLVMRRHSGSRTALAMARSATQKVTAVQPQSKSHRTSFALGVLAALLTTVAANAQPVTITGADTASLATPFSDGSITISPFGVDGNPTSFGPSTTFIGPDSGIADPGGDNPNALRDIDGDPSTIDDRERVDVELASGVALTQIQWGFTRANPILISGFAEDPQAVFAVNPGGGNSLAFDSISNTLAIFHPFFGGTLTTIDFRNGAATDGQTLSAVVNDFNQEGPQLAFTEFTYNTVFSTPVAGDVDGMNGVTIDDYNIIRDNFGVGATLAEGDLTGDGAVTIADFGVWEANFGGSSAGLAQLLGVPEPSSIALLSIGILGLLRRRSVSRR